jgi:hypothetical protein
LFAVTPPSNESRVPVDLPILIIAGTDDPVGGRTRTIQNLITRYMWRGHLALAYRFYAGGRHEILNEAEKDQVHRDVGLWLAQVLDRKEDATATMPARRRRGDDRWRQVLTALGGQCLTIGMRSPDYRSPRITSPAAHAGSSQASALTAATTRAANLRGRPGRGASARPSRPPLAEPPAPFAAGVIAVALCRRYP